MTPTDLPVLRDRLVELAEALGSKPVTAPGLAVWGQVLREFPLHDAVDILSGWAKRSNKMPAPSDVWKILNDHRTDQIEAAAIAERRTFAYQAAHTFQRSDKFARAIRSLAGDMQKSEPKDPKEWAQVLWNRYVYDLPNPDGSALSQAQIETACAAMRKTVKDAAESRASQRLAQRDAA